MQEQIAAPAIPEGMEVHGYYRVECHSRKWYRRLLAKLGIKSTLQWSDHFANLVTTVGKNHMLDTELAGSSYSATVIMGLISSTSYTGVAAGDTMASHGGWLEAGNANAPTYTAPRKTLAFSAASGGSKATSAAASFAITGTGTVKGAFVALGGATTTIDNTTGTLFSAGLFSGGDKSVANGDTINVSYTATLT